MENGYRLKERTPEKMKCILGNCPSIYETVLDVTPKEFSCILGNCPQVHKFRDNYLIIGKRVDPKEVGLVGKVGEGEVLISVPKALIDNKEK